MLLPGVFRPQKTDPEGYSMNFRLSRTALAVLGALACQTGLAADDSTTLELLSPVDVVDAPLPAAVTPVYPDELPPLRETADILRDIPGVSGSRMGGHGTDPSIRGLSQTRLNVLLDGAYVHGGCPNRMDPPTAYAPAASYEEVTVIKGVQTLEYGGGGPGGTILFERVTPRFGEDETLRGRLGGGYRGNGETWSAHGDVATGSEALFARVLGGYTDADSYEDGDGEEVRSAYTERSGTAILGYTPSTGTRLEFSAERISTRDLLFAGAGMDSPESDSDTYRLKFSTEESLRGVAALRAELYRSEVDHVMDNYTLREPANPMMLMRAPSSSDTTGGRLVGEVDSRYGRWKIGVDLQDNERDAVRVNDFNDTLNSVLWPGVSIEQRGIFGELTHPLDPRNRLVAGLRYDRVTSDASRADENPPGMPLSPNELYAIYYGGAQADKRTEDNWGGLLRYEHDLADRPVTLFAGFSRSMRTADATERFIASNSATPDGRWVGNPLLDPERHHQFEVGAVASTGAWDLSGSIFYNDVADYILRDRFRVDGNNATVYRNVDATLFGGELTAGYRWNARWRGELGLAYVHAQNDTDDLPIAQTPPLEGVMRLDYTATNWSAGARVRGAATQTRVDDDPLVGSGLDVGETSGWAVLDLYGRYELSDAVAVDLGVDNVFDHAYAQHLNRSSSFDPTQVQVNEPGLSAWVQLDARF
jgi:iron complex outermembrane receptor protein